MAEELRLVLTIIGVLAIVGIFGHGIWSVRKSKDGLRDMKTPPPRNEPGLNQTDNGLDSHGVGQPRTVKKEPVLGAANDTQQQHHGHEKGAIEPTVESAVANGEPVTAATDDQDHEKVASPHSSEKHADKPDNEKTDDAKVASEPSEVLILHLGMPEGQTISGAALLPQLLSMGFKFGEMDIFHRHENTSGTGVVLFSLANMYNPGTFDIDNMEQTQLRGLSLFMTLPCQGDALQNFNMMHNGAKKLAEEFGAQILDSHRSVMTVQTVRHYVEKIREFERKQLING